MSFLRKFGLKMLQIVGVVTGVGAVFQQVLPGAASGIGGMVGKVNDTLTEIASFVMIIEAAFASQQGQHGAAKLEAVLPFVAQAIQRSELLVGKEIMDEGKFTGAVRSIASGMADLLNSLKGDKVEIKKP